jgi:hypothetical protein
VDTAASFFFSQDMEELRQWTLQRELANLQQHQKPKSASKADTSKSVASGSGGGDGGAGGGADPGDSPSIVGYSA